MLIMLSACGPGSGPNLKPNNGKARLEALSLYDQQDYFAAVGLLSELYNDQPSDEAVYVALLDSWFQLGEMPRVWKLLHENQLVSPRATLIEAEMMASQNACLDALNLVDDWDSLTMEADWQARKLKFVIDCSLKTKQYLSAAKALVALNRYLQEPVEIQNNRDLIVKSLLMVDEEDLLFSIGDLSLDALTQGWIEAAYVNFGADGVSGQAWLTQWPTHPAASYFLDLNRVSNQQKVAVLLPFSGRFADVAKAVQKGMLAAALSDFNGQNELMFFDTGSAGENLSDAWFSAQEYQADLIIGPIDKDSIEQITLMPEPTVPVVLLNQSETHYFQFTLSPEAEAEEVAEKMIADGMKRVLILAPNEAWGERMTTAFAQRFVDLGGYISNNAYFQPQQNDYSAQLRQTLGLVESQLRARNLEQFLKLDINSEEVVRSDVDGIFLAAKPAFARLMIPQLKFHRAADIPVYSSSHVFNGLHDEQHNKDLEGVKFAISPMELEASYLQEVLPFDLKLIHSDKKLFAFGFDAYQLIARIEWMSRVNTGFVEGLTGTISLGMNKHFRRQLLWAEYHNGGIDYLSN